MIALTVGYAHDANYIYAYDPVKANNRNYQDVTKACIDVVMDYMLADMPIGKNSVGYERPLKVGNGKLKLICIVEKEENTTQTEDKNGRK